ncbi:MAG: undecaprenyl/decaprenyl-phosphate alpha-N-acetylglucosaminyl 1-phosphate transferase [Candidatus Omnitrophica bacterium]|nr:undecaprenyl/decaprenyl-phosphate alpha-N-acetylglucosaminyl 1-phosphate transferase [Candidatus Omnitrophota bacterium]
MSIKIFLMNFLIIVVAILSLRKIVLRFKPKGIYLKKENKEIAKVGGIVLLLSILIFWRFFNPYLFLSLIFIFLLGFIDDLKELKVWQKFLGELIIALIFMLTSGTTTEIIFFPKSINFIITLIWILGITNAFNLLDIQDGLATGVGFLVSLAFLYLAHFTKNLLAEQISLLLSSSLLGILIFNFPPAKIYLGDSGSLSLGYLFSILAISLSYAQASHEMAIFSPVFILGFPIFDTIFVSLRRLSKGKSIFKKSDDHFILCLIKSGKKDKALFICYFLSLLFILLGILFTRLNNVFSLILIILFLNLLYRISSKLSEG